MTRTLSALCFFIVTAVYATAAQQQLAFERDGSIWVSNIDGINARKITKGSAPDLSADGTRIAFHTDTSTEKDVVRQIAVVDVPTKKVTVFKKEIPSENCQRAIWSPDGAHILFTIWSDSDWHLALVNADGSGFRYLKKTETKGNSLWSFCWTPDSKSVYAQDLNNLYLIDMNGKELRKWELKSLFADGSFNSGSNIAVSPDGKTLLMEVDMDNEEANMPDWDGPPPSIWTMDIGSGKGTRLSPKGVLAWHGVWLDPSGFVFSAQTPKEKKPSVYRATVRNPERKLVIKNANSPSVSKSTP
jgi:TolB protein